jgi:hypothetical protein
VIIAEEWPESASKLGIKLKNALRIRALAACENNNDIKLILLCSALEAIRIDLISLSESKGTVGASYPDGVLLPPAD